MGKRGREREIRKPYFIIDTSFSMNIERIIYYIGVHLLTIDVNQSLNRIFYSSLENIAIMKNSRSYNILKLKFNNR